MPRVWGPERFKILPFFIRSRALSFPTFPPVWIVLLVVALTLIETVPTTRVYGQTAAENPDGLDVATDTDASESEPTPIEVKVTDLSSDSYLRRKRATMELKRIGCPAVPALVAQLKTGDLETTERVIGILQEIASSVSIVPPPLNETTDEGETSIDPDRAWNELSRLATLGGSQGARAKLATQEVRDVRREQAMTILQNHRAFIGISDFIVGAREMPKFIVEIDDNFSGGPDVIALLRWLDGIQYARVKGTAIRSDVLSGIVRMPDLNTLSLMQGELNLDEMKTLGGLAELRHLELRYIPMSGELVDQLAVLPIRVSLTLNGTAAPIDRVDALRRMVPGLDIELKQGGFLGVRCFDNFNECLINEVITGKSAELAGLLPGDTILQADGKPIKQFKDLQDAINAHVPGDTIEIEYRRGETETKTMATLGKLEDK